MGGLGIQNSSLMNKALLCKWWWKLFNTERLWQDVILNKYQKGASLSWSKSKQGDSQFWAELLKHKDHFSLYVNL